MHDPTCLFSELALCALAFTVVTDMSSNGKRVFARAWNKPRANVVPLGTAVFCLDCEAISNSRGDECQACGTRSLVSLARILGGSLGEHQVEPGIAGRSFDITLTIELHAVPTQDVNSTVEELTNVIGASLPRGRASFHVRVQPTAGKPFRAA
jgi:hypothetical protein